MEIEYVYLIALIQGVLCGLWIGWIKRKHRIELDRAKAIAVSSWAITDVQNALIKAGHINQAKDIASTVTSSRYGEDGLSIEEAAARLRNVLRATHSVLTPEYAPDATR